MKKRNFNPPEEEYDPSQDIGGLDMEKQNLMQQNNQMAGALANNGFNEQEEQNVIQSKLETDKILERIEHFLKGDQVKFNEQGAYFTEPTKNVLALVKMDNKSKVTYYIQEFKEQSKGTELLKEVLVKIKNKDGEEINVLEVDSKRILDKLKNLKLENEGYKYISVLDEEKKPLNEYGVSEMMRILSMYVTKETFLSNYNEERINEILGDLGDALSEFLYCNYEKMGMDTKFKESKYKLIVLNILHVVESCYRRAIGGAEQETMITRSLINSNQGGYGNMGNVPMNKNQKKKWSPLKPSTW